jgi:DNA-binding NtrC family response regulator
MEMQMTDETPALSESRDLKTLLEEFERGIIVEALQTTGGNQRRAARSLGLLPTTLHEKMKRLGLIERPPHLLRENGRDATR